MEAFAAVEIDFFMHKLRQNFRRLEYIYGMNPEVPGLLNIYVIIDEMRTAKMDNFGDLFVHHLRSTQTPPEQTKIMLETLVLANEWIQKQVNIAFGKTMGGEDKDELEEILER